MEAAVEFLWWVVSKVIFMSNLTTVLRLCFVLLCCCWGCDYNALNYFVMKYFVLKYLSKYFFLPLHFGLCTVELSHKSNKVNSSNFII